MGTVSSPLETLPLPFEEGKRPPEKKRRKKGLGEQASTRNFVIPKERPKKKRRSHGGRCSLLCYVMLSCDRNPADPCDSNQEKKKKKKKAGFFLAVC